MRHSSDTLRAPPRPHRRCPAGTPRAGSTLPLSVAPAPFVPPSSGGLTQRRGRKGRHLLSSRRRSTLRTAPERAAWPCFVTRPRRRSCVEIAFVASAHERRTQKKQGSPVELRNASLGSKSGSNFEIFFVESVYHRQGHSSLSCMGVKVVHGRGTWGGPSQT